MPVSKLMINRNQWPQFSEDLDVITAIKLLRIVTEDRKLEHGHSTPLVVDSNFDLLGFVHLTDLLKSAKHVWESTEKTGVGSPRTLKELVVPFAGTVKPEDNIIDALNIMMEHTVSMVPVKKNGRLEGMVKLSDVFNEVAALLFDETDPNVRHQMLRDYHAY
ncbi:MAG: CBS domain-containing protein [Pseudomonadota bacterium]